MESGFVGFCYVCGEDTIFRNEQESELFGCVRCGGTVKITVVEEAHSRDVTAA